MAMLASASVDHHSNQAVLVHVIFLFSELFQHFVYIILFFLFFLAFSPSTESLFARVVYLLALSSSPFSCSMTC